MLNASVQPIEEVFILAKALNDNTKFLTPSALDRLSSVDTILDKIGKDILTRQEISQCYIDLDAEDGISYSDNKASTNPILKQSSGRKAHFTFCPILLIRRSTNLCDLSLNSQGMTSISLPSGAAT